MTSASPRSILVFSGRYHIISNASLVNNCIIILISNHRSFNELYEILTVAGHAQYVNAVDDYVQDLPPHPSRKLHYCRTFV